MPSSLFSEHSILVSINIISGQRGVGFGQQEKEVGATLQK